MAKIIHNTLRKDSNTAKILGIGLNSSSQSLLLESLVQKIKKTSKILIFTPNPEFIVFAQEHSWFKKVLNKADFAIPDGIGLIWASRFLGKPIKERIHGTDLMEKLCFEASQQGWTIFLLGGEPGVAQKAFRILQQRYPSLKGWAESGPRLDLDNWPEEVVVDWVRKVNQKKPDLLFVGFGMGKQEKFLYEDWSVLNVRLAIGVGGAFDYLSGRIPRAPVWIRKIGLEWFFRLIFQPWRIKRQLALVKFIGLVLKEKYKTSFYGY